jgi:ABC-type ATPase with predicted acetyltransferase domain
MRRRRQFFWIRHVRKTYDRSLGKFSFNISYSTSATVTPRTIAVAEAFGLGLDESQKFTVLDVTVKIKPTDIVYVTGDSGSGKSVLLRALKEDLLDEVADIGDVKIDEARPIIETVGETVEKGLELLSKVGLNDAFLFLRSYGQLSDGQKYRYRVAKLLESGKAWWILDEFAATLDRDTAKILSWNLQKLARQEGKCVIAATTHNDLFHDLQPDVHIHKRFGKEIQVRYHRKVKPGPCSLVKGMVVEEGSLRDWRALADFHYRSHNVPPPRKIFVLRRKWHELCGVIVYTYPPPACAGRRLMLPHLPMHEVNKILSNVSRVVIHPKYRSLGLGARLIHETLPLVGTDCVEMTAVMAKYNPFAEKAGMQKVAVQMPSKEAVKIRDLLEEVGFDIQFLNSKKHVQERLSRLDQDDILKIKAAFMKYKHPRFLKTFTSHVPFGQKEIYQGHVADASLERLGDLIRTASFLLQTKVYLFWGRADIHRQ